MKRAFVIMLACLIAVQAFSGEKKSGGKNDRGGKEKQEFSGHKGGPGGHGRGGIIDACLKSEKMQEKLGLSEDQLSKLKKISDGLKARQEKLKSKRQEHGMEQVKEMMGKDPSEIDEAAVMKGVEQAGRVQTEMNKLRMKEMLEFNKVLTSEQRVKMTKMRQQREQKMKKMRERMKEKGKDGCKDSYDQGDDDDEEKESRRKKRKNRQRKRNDDSDDDDDTEEEV